MNADTPESVGVIGFNRRTKPAGGGPGTHPLNINPQNNNSISLCSVSFPLGNAKPPSIIHHVGGASSESGGVSVALEGIAQLASSQSNINAQLGPSSLKTSFKAYQPLIHRLISAYEHLRDEEEKNRPSFASNRASLSTNQASSAYLVSPPAEATHSILKPTSPTNSKTQRLVMQSTNAYSEQQIQQSLASATQESPRSAQSAGSRNTASTPQAPSVYVSVERQKLALVCQQLQEAVMTDIGGFNSIVVPGLVDYKTIALESSKALSLLVRMLKADVSLVRTIPFIPADVIEPQVSHLRSLLEETCKKFGIPLSSISPPSGGSKKSVSGAGGHSSASNAFSSNTLNFMHSSDAPSTSAEGSGGSKRFGGGGKPGVGLLVGGAEGVPSITVAASTPLVGRLHSIDSGSESSPFGQHGKGFNASTGINHPGSLPSNAAKLNTSGGGTGMSSSFPSVTHTAAGDGHRYSADAAAHQHVSPETSAVINAGQSVVEGSDSSELYDVRVLFGPSSSWREVESDDQNALLRNIITQLTAEKQELQFEVDSMEKQMVSLRERLAKQTEKALRVQQQIEVDLRHLTNQLGLTSVAVTSPVDAGIVGGGTASTSGSTTQHPYNLSTHASIPHPPPAVGGVFEVVRRHIPTSSGANSASSPDPSATREGHPSSGGPIQSVSGAKEDATVKREYAVTSTPFSSPLTDLSAANSSSAVVGNASGGVSVSSRYQRLEAVYYALYEGRGMEMIWNVIDTVYRNEFEAPAVAGSPMKVSSPAALQSASAGALPLTPVKPLIGGRHVDMSPPSPRKSPMTGPAEQRPSDCAVSPDPGRNRGNNDIVEQSNYHDPYKSFIELFNAFIVSPLSTEQSFNKVVRNVTPLRTDYVANCLHHRVKANSGVVRLLSLETSDSRVTELNLDGNYIGDNGLVPLLPLFARMHNLATVRLAHNGLRNDGVTALCKAIAIHPSISRIDVSHNTISRTGGKQILSLVSSNRRITYVGLEETAMDAALRGRIEAAALANLNHTAGGGLQL